MLIIGAGGFAKQLIETISQLKLTENVSFYDDTSDIRTSVFNRFPIIKSEKEAIEFFEKGDATFVIGVGDPKDRKILFNKFNQLNTLPVNLISPQASVSDYVERIETGIAILPGAVIEGGVILSKGVLVNVGAIVTHETYVGEFSAISPGAILLGECSIGSCTTIGAGAIVLPKIVIGKNVIIGAGAVVNRDVSDNSIMVGNPARKIN